MWIPAALFLVVWYSGGGSAYQSALDHGSGRVAEKIFQSRILAVCIIIYVVSAIAMIVAALFCGIRLIAAKRRDEDFEKAIWASIIFFVATLPAVFLLISPFTNEVQLKLRIFPVGLIVSSLIFGFSSMTVVLLMRVINLSRTPTLEDNLLD